MASEDAYFSYAIQGVHNYAKDVAYQLGLLIDNDYVRSLMDFERYIEGGRLDTFRELFQDVDEDTVRRYARASVMMLEDMDKSSTHLHIQ
ncbi:hypothetical protein AHAS_Ahas01G0178500 [Arachis hypogaea]